MLDEKPVHFNFIHNQYSCRSLAQTASGEILWADIMNSASSPIKYSGTLYINKSNRRLLYGDEVQIQKTSLYEQLQRILRT